MERSYGTTQRLLHKLGSTYEISPARSVSLLPNKTGDSLMSAGGAYSIVFFQRNFTDES